MFMQNKNTVLECITKPSPFHLEENWKLKIENQNKNCTHAEIDILMSKGILSEIDLEIMKLLAKFHYVNSFNITLALKHSLASAYQKEHYHANIKKLVRAGVLLKYSFVFNDDSFSSGSPMSALRFYSLSSGAQSYTSSFVDTPLAKSNLSIDYQIIEQLATNQLLIQLSSTYRSSSINYILNSKKAVGAHLLNINAFIRYKITSSKSIEVFLLCGRDLIQSQRNLTARILLLFDWLNHHQPNHPYMILILLESLPSIISTTKQLNSHATTSFRCPVYFSLDTNLLLSSLFDSLYQCFANDETSALTIQKVSLDFK